MDALQANITRKDFESGGADDHVILSAALRSNFHKSTAAELAQLSEAH